MNRPPSHEDRTRDLRRAPREPPLILRGVLEVMALPAKRHTFRAAGGRSIDDFYLLGRTSSTRERSESLLLHVVHGEVKGAHSVDEPLMDLYVTPEGIIWGLSHSGTAVRFAAEDAPPHTSGARKTPQAAARTFPLHRGSRGRTWWYGIGGAGDRVLAWGAGALLQFDGEKFVPFEPDAGLEEYESVVALCAQKREITMLVCGDRVGAVARFDGRKWVPITEDQVIEGQLCDLDVWRGVSIVLARTGELWRIEAGGKPRPVIWDDRHQAFINESGQKRPAYAAKGFDGGALIASDGGVISVGAGEPIFHAAPACQEETHLARVGSERAWDGPGKRRASDPGTSTPGVVATCGGHAWILAEGRLLRHRFARVVRARGRLDRALTAPHNARADESPPFPFGLARTPGHDGAGPGRCRRARLRPRLRRGRRVRWRARRRGAAQGGGATRRSSRRHDSRRGRGRR